MVESRRFDTRVDSSAAGLAQARGDVIAGVDVGMTEDEFYGLSREKRVEILFGGVDNYHRIMTGSAGIEIATLDFVSVFNAVHKGQNKTGLLGYPWSDLIADYDALVAKRSLFETKSYFLAADMARKVKDEAQRVARSLGIDIDAISERRRLLYYDFCSGAGGITAALAAQEQDRLDIFPATVVAIEADQHIVSHFTHNMVGLAIQNVHTNRDNVIDYLRNSRPNGNGLLGFNGVGAFIDVPFRAAYYSSSVWVNELGDLYLLSDGGMRYLDPTDIAQKLELKKRRHAINPDDVEKDRLLNVEEIIALVFSRQVVPVIGVAVPPEMVAMESFSSAAMRIDSLLGDDWNVGVTVCEHIGNDGERPLKEKQAVFRLQKPGDQRTLYEEETFRF